MSVYLLVHVHMSYHTHGWYTELHSNIKNSIYMKFSPNPCAFQTVSWQLDDQSL